MICRRELGNMDRLLVGVQCAKDGARVDVEDLRVDIAVSAANSAAAVCDLQKPS